MNNRILLCLFILSFILSAGCADKPSAIPISDRTVYGLKKNQVSFVCSRPASIDSNVLYPQLCEVVIEKFEQHCYYREIVATTESKWLTLLQSDSDVAVSAAKWLYFLSKEPINLVEIILLNRWTKNTRQQQLLFWKSYLEKKDISDMVTRKNRERFS